MAKISILMIRGVLLVLLFQIFAPPFFRGDQNRSNKSDVLTYKNPFRDFSAPDLLREKEKEKETEADEGLSLSHTITLFDFEGHNFNLNRIHSYVKPTSDAIDLRYKVTFFRPLVI